MSRRLRILAGLGILIGGVMIYQLLKQKPEKEKKEEISQEELRRECKARVAIVCSQAGGTLRDKCINNEISIATYECDTIYQCCLSISKQISEEEQVVETPPPGERIIGVAGATTIGAAGITTTQEVTPTPPAPSPAPSPPPPEPSPPPPPPPPEPTPCPPPLEYYCDPALNICYCRKPPEPFVPAPGCPETAIPRDWCEYCKLVLKGCIRPTVVNDYNYCLNLARGYIAVAPCLGCPPEDVCPELKKIYNEITSRTPITTQPEPIEREPIERGPIERELVT